MMDQTTKETDFSINFERLHLVNHNTQYEYGIPEHPPWCLFDFPFLFHHIQFI